ncbi:MAG: FAD-dependent oxidoreductase [Flavipsychrobacter sp.]
MQVDHIIIGQGVSGTMLSYHLVKRGKRVMVIDKSVPYSASKVASGVINPVTGRRVVSTWMIDELLPFSWQAYEELEEELGVSIISQKDILSFHANEQMKQAFYDKLEENEAYVEVVQDEEAYKELFHFTYGIGKVTPVYLVELQNLITAWRKRLVEQDSLLDAYFDWSKCTVDEKGVKYEGIEAKSIILCNGVQGNDDPYFKRLPYAMTKGEALVVRIPNLSAANIYKQGYNIVPWKDDLFWVGSSFDRDYNDVLPSESFKTQVKTQLDKWLKLPYEFVAHIASERAGTIERRPFVGMHPIHTNVGVFNGMGTKGCSLAPYFANQFADHLVKGTAIDEAANVLRFRKILER